MNIQSIKRTLKLAAFAAVAGFVGASAMHTDASASPYKDTNRINAIIHQLDPSGWSYTKPYKSYRYIPSYRYKKHHYKDYRYGYETPYKYYDYGYAVDHFDYRGMDMSVYFARGSNKITWKAKRVLNDLGYALTSARLRNAVYRIAGHTDARGDYHANQILSEQRARAVKRYLVRKFGINPRRLVAVGYGQKRLLNSYRPYSSINRRVEVTLIANSYADMPYDWHDNRH